MNLKLVAGLLTMTLSAGVANSGRSPGDFALSAQALWQHGWADHAGVNLQPAPTCEPSTEGCA